MEWSRYLVFYLGIAFSTADFLIDDSNQGLSVANECPNLYKEVDENEPIGSALFQFGSHATHLDLQPESPGGRQDGFLSLTNSSVGNYTVVLNHTLDLNVLNPQPPPPLKTQEDVECNATGAETGERLSELVSLEYILKCTLTINNVNSVTVQSYVRITIRNVNDKPPVFQCSPYHKTISELTPVSSTVFTLRDLAYDPDLYGGITGYSLQDGSGDHFVMTGAASDGFVTVNKPLDYDAGIKTFALNITARDSGSPPLLTWSMLYLELADADDQNPVFDHLIHYLTVAEQNRGVGRRPLVTHPPLHAHDLDLGVGAAVRYSIAAGNIINTVQYFDIDENTGLLRTLEVLDRLQTPQFILQIKAYQVDNPLLRFSYATVVVTVEDSNSHAPHMIQTAYNVTIPENSPIGYHVVTVGAIDNDQGTNAEFAYYAIDPGGVFIAGPSTGVIMVSNSSSLDREVQAYHVLTVYAEETGTAARRRSDNCTVYVTLSDINDNNPVFGQQMYHFLVNKSTPVHTPVGTVRATDADDGRNGEVHYRIVHSLNGASNYYSLDITTGELFIVESLLNQHKGPHVLTIQAVDNPSVTSQKRSSYAIVEIQISDANEHPPVFNETVYNVTVPENMSIGSPLLTLQATDADENSPSYHVSPDSPYFDIHSGSGILYLASLLNREEQDVHILTITASDGLYETFCLVYITVEDVNDNTPHFSVAKYIFSVSENMATNTVIGIVQAYDTDAGHNADITYQLQGTWILQYMDIDNTTGTLTTRQPFDREAISLFNLSVIASDRGSPPLSSTAEVTVYVTDINDNAPAFPEDASYTLTLPEGSVPGVIFTFQASDADVGENAEITYHLLSEDPQKHFQLEAGVLSLLAPLDLEGSTSQRLYVLHITARNTVSSGTTAGQQGSTATLTINVEDVNDHVPVFTMSQYDITVSENTNPGTSIGRVVALDADYSWLHRRVHYWLPLGDQAAVRGLPLLVDEFTGVLRLMHNLDYDPPHNDRNIVLEVYASNEAPSFGNVWVNQTATGVINITITDSNDNTPKFTQNPMRVSVPENTTVTSVVAVVSATDLDSGERGSVFYDQLSSHSVFQINSVTGKVQLIDSLDYESASKIHTVTVAAIDRGVPYRSSTGTLILTVTNVNDEWPAFSKTEYSASVTENQPPGNLVVVAAATDKDGDKLRYSLQGTHSDLFTINSFGEIRTQSPLDYEETKSYRFNVVATEAESSDGLPIGTPHTSIATVMVRVRNQNDNAPKFSQDVYHTVVQEGAPNDTLLQVYASDADPVGETGMRYRLQGGDALGVFHLHAVTGLLTVVGGQEIHYTKARHYTLTVLAHDDGSPPMSTMALVEIEVEDTNDHPPVFSSATYTGQVRENSPEGTTVLQVSATDVDTRDTILFSIAHQSIGADLFEISSSGVITTRQPLDREQHDSHSLRVTAFDGIHSTDTYVAVRVKDMNDNAPIFSESSYQKQLQTHTKKGSVVLVIRASDKDEEENGFVTHWLTGGQGKFYLDPFSGVMTLTTDVDSGFQDKYQLIVFAQDHGQVVLTSNVSVLVTVSTDNNHAPRFVEFGYHFIVPENTSVGGYIGKLNVSDMDEGATGNISLKLVNEYDRKHFNIQSNGVFRLSKELDYEAQKHYTVLVRASDNAKESLTSTALVKITVTDVNDHAPVFVSLPHVVLSGPTGSQSLVTQLAALDADSVLNGNNQIKYSVLSHTDMFSVDSTSGVLRTSVYVGSGDYVISVRARDQALLESLSTDSSVHLTVLNSTMLQVYPMFFENVYYVNFNESHSQREMILDVNASFPGLMADAGILYDIVHGNMSLFHIDSETGELFVVKALDRETQPQHHLVISAKSIIHPTYISQAMVYVTVIDFNDEAPTFPYDQYDVLVPEDTPQGTTVTTLFAEDPDLNSQLWFSIIAMDGPSPFEVSSLGGSAVITTKEVLDYETMTVSDSTYTLLVLVTDGPHSGSPAQVRIQVADVNDNVPLFSLPYYNTTILEDLRPCSEVIQVTASDPDVVDKESLVYKLTPESTFGIDSKTGVVHLRCDGQTVLDREHTAGFDLTIHVEDSGSNQETTVLHIDVLDVNDNAPIFMNTPYLFYTLEGPKSLGLNMTLTAVDADTGVNSEISFRMLGEYAPYFSISQGANPENGSRNAVVQVVKELDRERLQTTNRTAVVTLWVEAIDHGRPTLSSSTQITVLVDDVNDSPPVFDQASYEVSITESTPVNTPILTLAASDLDFMFTGVSSLQYYLQQSSGDAFALERDSGRVIVHTPLNMAVQPAYTLRATVTDGMHTAQTTIHVILIDVNDHDPAFSQAVYYFSVQENDNALTTGQEVGEVSASDMDSGENGRVLYNITSRSAQGIFAITNVSKGAISVVGVVDRESVDSYTLTVTAIDRGSPSRMSTCEVVITVLDVNDNTPQFTRAPYTGRITEHATAGTVVFVVETDEHPGVVAQDRDIKLNAELQFGLAGDKADLFHVDSVSGIITVTETGSRLLDRETQDSLILQVLAYDRNGDTQSLTGTTTIVISILDINDNPPEFDQAYYNLTVNEASSPGSAIGALRSHDLDAAPNNRIMYSIMSGSAGRFYIDRLTGELFVAGGLDRETRDTYQLNVSATDTGVNPGPLESYTVVYIVLEDYNDNAPDFSPSSVTLNVPENMESGVVFGRVTAFDGDVDNNAIIKYEIKGSSNIVPFQVDLNTGDIATVSMLDREETSYYRFQVIAYDLGLPRLTATLSVEVNVDDMNDHPPHFELSEYHVSLPEKSSIESVVLLPRARDFDSLTNANLTFSLSSLTNAQDYFAIDLLSGLVLIANEIDRSIMTQDGLLDVNGTMVLTLTVTDNGDPPLSGEASLIITVGDMSGIDWPQFEQSLYNITTKEQQPLGTPVLAVSTKNYDGGQLTYSVMGEPYFTFTNPHEGFLVTTRIPLDRELSLGERHYLTLTLMVVDNNTPQRTAYSMVTVYIEDINDNAPVFSQDVYEFSVVEGVYTLPYLVGQLSASDLDYGANAQLTFHSIEHDTDTFVYVDITTGGIYAKGNVDRENQSSYSLTVQARDQGKNALTGTTTVKVIVRDINDNAPKFLDGGEDGFSVTMRASDVPPYQLLEVSAVDPDSELNGTIVYDLDINRTHTPFYIQNRGGKGILRLAAPFRYDVGHVYNLSLLAYDLGQPSLMTATTVSVSVEPNQLNMPEFEKDVYQVEINLETPTNETIAWFNAGSGSYKYSLKEGNALFEVDALTGELSLSRHLTTSDIDIHDLIIKVVHAKNFSLTDTTRLLVTVVASGGAPMFTQPQYTASVPENTSPPHLLLDINTVQENRGQAVSYFLIGQTYGVFHVEEPSGRVLVTHNLDREQRTQYTLRLGASAGITSNRTRGARSTTSGVNEVLVIINVADENDNWPVYAENPLVFGVSGDTTYNDLIGSVKANDLDSGNYSTCVYELLGDSSAVHFHVHPLTANLYARATLSYLPRKHFNLIVQATDNWGKGYSVQNNIRVLVLSDPNRLLLVADESPIDLTKDIDQLLGNLSAMLGVRMKVEKMEPHIYRQGSTVSVNFQRTDVYLYAINNASDLLSSEDVLREADERSKDIDMLFRQYGVLSLTPLATPSESSSSQADVAMDGTLIALIVLAGIIVFGTIIGTVWVAVTWNQYKKKTAIIPAKPHPQSNGTKPQNGLSNPAYTANGYSHEEVYSEPLEIDVDGFSSFKPVETRHLSLLLHPDDSNGTQSSTNNNNAHSRFENVDDLDVFNDCKPMETQLMSVYINEEGLGSHVPDTNQNTQWFGSIDDEGNTVIIVDNHPGPGAAGETEAWAAPAGGDMAGGGRTHTIRCRGNRAVNIPIVPLPVCLRMTENSVHPMDGTEERESSQDRSSCSSSSSSSSSSSTDSPDDPVCVHLCSSDPNCPNPKTDDLAIALPGCVISHENKRNVPVQHDGDINTNPLQEPQCPIRTHMKLGQVTNSPFQTGYCTVISPLEGHEDSGYSSVVSRSSPENGCSSSKDPGVGIAAATGVCHPENSVIVTEYHSPQMGHTKPLLCRIGGDVSSEFGGKVDSVPPRPSRPPPPRPPPPPPTQAHALQPSTQWPSRTVSLLDTLPPPLATGDDMSHSTSAPPPLPIRNSAAICKRFILPTVDRKSLPIMHPTSAPINVEHLPVPAKKKSFLLPTRTPNLLLLPQRLTLSPPVLVSQAVSLPTDMTENPSPPMFMSESMPLTSNISQSLPPPTLVTNTEPVLPSTTTSVGSSLSKAHALPLPCLISPEPVSPHTLDDPQVLPVSDPIPPPPSHQLNGDPESFQLPHSFEDRSQILERLILPSVSPQPSTRLSAPPSPACSVPAPTPRAAGVWRELVKTIRGARVEPASGRSHRKCSAQTSGAYKGGNNSCSKNHNRMKRDVTNLETIVEVDSTVDVRKSRFNVNESEERSENLKRFPVTETRF